MGVIPFSDKLEYKMEIYLQKNLNGQSIFFKVNEVQFQNIFLNVIKIFPNNVIKTTLDNGDYFITVDLVTDEEVDEAINYFKETGLYSGVCPVDDFKGIQLNREIFYASDLKSIRDERKFILYNMPNKALNGLTPLNAINIYGESAFLQLFANYDLFNEDEKPFIGNALRVYLNKKMKYTQFDILQEEDVKDFLYTYQSIYQDILPDILRNKYKNLADFCKYESLDSLRDAGKTVSNHLLSKMML